MWDKCRECGTSLIKYQTLDTVYNRTGLCPVCFNPNKEIHNENTSFNAEEKD